MIDNETQSALTSFPGPDKSNKHQFYMRFFFFFFLFYFFYLFKVDYW